MSLMLKIMTVCNKTYFLFLVFGLLFGSVARGQSTYQIGVLPSLTVNNKLQKGWSLHSEVDSRQRLKSGDFNSVSKTEYQYILTDFSLITAKKIGSTSRIGGGYLVRFREGVTFHRLIQQYTLIQKTDRFRWAHRFSTDLTLSKLEQPELRLRYRIGTEIPLNDASVDANGVYLKISNEFLNSWQGENYDLEIRIVPLLGYKISNVNKLEVGIDYRLNSFIKGNDRHVFWLSLNWLVEI